MIVNMINNKRLNPVVTELFIRGRKVALSHNHTLKYLTILDLILHTSLL